MLIEILIPLSFLLLFYQVVRLGHPARIIEDVQKHSLDAIIENHESSDVIKDLKAEISSKCVWFVLNFYLMVLVSFSTTK